MTNKVRQSNFNIKIDKDSENKGLDYSNITNNISDRGDSGKENVKLDGLEYKDSINKENETRKSIDVFIKQYLPDRGDSKRLRINKINRITNNIHIKNKNSTVVDSDIEKSSNKIDEKGNNRDILIIPETGEKVCKTDIKLSYTKPTTATVKENDALSIRSDFKSKINNVYDSKIRRYDRHDLQSKKEVQLKNSKSTGQNTYFNENLRKGNNDSGNKNINKNQKRIREIERKIDEQVPLKVSSQFIDQILNQAGVSADFRERNELLHYRAQETLNKENKLTNNTLKQYNNYAKNLVRNEQQTSFSVKEDTELSKRNKLHQLNQIINDQLDARNDGSKKLIVSGKERVQIDPNERKKTRTRIMKLKNNNNRDEDLNKRNENKTPKYNEKPAKPSNEDESKQNISSTDSRKSTNLKKSETGSKRKAIIKTITAKKDAKVYKAVTFVDYKHTTPLQVNIPEVKRRVSNIINASMRARVKNIVSKVSLKEKTVTRRDSRKRKQNKHMSSPEASMGKESPPTEVAKWAPSCINEHTRPYYEAWVNTTLAAIARDGGNDEIMLEKQRIIENFKRALDERPRTPELVYEGLLDEKYTGRITVRQRCTGRTKEKRNRRKGM